MPIKNAKVVPGCKSRVLWGPYLELHLPKAQSHQKGYYPGRLQLQPYEETGTSDHRPSTYRSRPVEAAVESLYTAKQKFEIANIKNSL